VYLLVCDIQLNFASSFTAIPLLYRK